MIHKTKTFSKGKDQMFWQNLMWKVCLKKVTYYSFLQEVLRDFATDTYINSIIFRARDEDGMLFDFKGLPLKFELEIN